MKNAYNAYQNIKIIYRNNPYNIIFTILSTMLVLCIVMLMNIIEQVVFAEQSNTSIQFIIFNISSQLLYTGMMIGLIKIIFSIIDDKDKKIIDIFSHFELFTKN